VRRVICGGPLEYLSVLEMRLIGSCWGGFNNADAFNWAGVAPPFAESDRALFAAITGALEFDPFDERVQAIVNQMRSDIVTAQLMDGCALMTPHWTEVEFQSVAAAIANYGAAGLSDGELHARRALLGKSTGDVALFARGLVDRPRGTGVSVPAAVAQRHGAPAATHMRPLSSWTRLSG